MFAMRSTKKVSIRFAVSIVLVVLLALGLLVETQQDVSAASLLAGTNRFVATNGNDANAGTIDSPWKTIQHAVDTAVAGDTIFIRGGTYSEAVNIKKSGASGNPISLTIYNGESVTINGGSGSAISTSASEWWIIDGLILKSTARDTILLSWWGTNKSTNNWIIRNNTITGATFMIGANNLWENNHIDGTGYTYTSGDAGIQDATILSHNNTFRGNHVTNFTQYSGRGMWFESGSHDDLVENNLVENVTGSMGQCYDFDGYGPTNASNNSYGVEYGHTFRNNTARNCGYVDFQGENLFNSTITDNYFETGKASAIALIQYDSGNCGYYGGWGDKNGNGSCVDETASVTMTGNQMVNSGWTGSLTCYAGRGFTFKTNAFYASTGRDYYIDSGKCVASEWNDPSNSSSKTLPGTATPKPATPTFTKTPTTVLPTATKVPATPTSISPTATVILPTATKLPATATAIQPTSTNVPPTATTVPPTSTKLPATATAIQPTNTNVPPTATVVLPTSTKVPPTATVAQSTPTKVQPTATVVPPTATKVPPTATVVQPTPTIVQPSATIMPPTPTKVPPTATKLPPTPTKAAPTPTIQPQPTSTPASSPITLNLKPEADAYVDAQHPGTNYGNSIFLNVRDNPMFRSYLRFNVTGLNGKAIKSATLRLRVNNNNTTVPMIVRSVSNTTWSEKKITYKNMPALGSIKIASPSNYQIFTWIEIDVTPLVKGEGKVSMALTVDQHINLAYASKEIGNESPRLVVVTQP